LSASQPQATVISNTIAIWVNNRVIKGVILWEQKLVYYERPSQSIELATLWSCPQGAWTVDYIWLAPGFFCRSAGIKGETKSGTTP
jgi:hypothetical protein